jgi:hypothetical protein
MFHGVLNKFRLAAAHCLSAKGGDARYRLRRPSGEKPPKFRLQVFDMARVGHPVRHLETREELLE